MIGKLAFEGLCSHAADGLPIRALFITPNAPARNQQHLEMLNVASARDLNPVFFQANRRLEVGPAVAFLRIAHPYLDRELKGLEWHFIHGLEYLEAFDEGDAIKLSLEALVRL